MSASVFRARRARYRTATLEPRAIRGRASLAEAKSLLEDGIEILPFPGLPGEGN